MEILELSVAAPSEVIVPSPSSVNNWLADPSTPTGCRSETDKTPLLADNPVAEAVPANKVATSFILPFEAVPDAPPSRNIILSPAAIVAAAASVKSTLNVVVDKSNSVPAE